MGEARHDGLAVPGRVILAHEPPFRIGKVSVRPSTRQIEHGDRHETLEPRVMQVLVALASAKGAIVTREELSESCWDGRVVGDDSINRVLSRIRRVAADIGGGSFTIETIARVGYRLVAAEHSDEVRHISGGRSRFDRRTLVAGGAAVATLGVVGTAAIWPWFTERKAPLPEAKALYDRAVILRHQDNRQALAHLREAVRISPEYGQAWGALALAYRTAINDEAPERVAGFEERLEEAAHNAEQYDPGNGDAAAAQLPAGSWFGRWSDFESVYRSAIRRNPEHVAGYSLLGTVLMDVGRWSDAAAALRLAKGRNSSSPVLRYKLIVSLWSAGRISAAEDEIAEAMQLWPQHGAIWQTKIKLLAFTGRPREALALASDPAAKPGEERDAPNHDRRLLILRGLATGSSRSAEQAVEAMVEQAREVEGDRVTMALFLAALGRLELALDMLEGAYLGAGPRRRLATRFLATHPLFQPHARPLWREPRFNRILQSVGLERYWRDAGVPPDYRRDR